MLIYQRVSQLVQQELAVVELHLIELGSDVNLRSRRQSNGAHGVGGHVRHQAAELKPGSAFYDGDALGALELFEAFGLGDEGVELPVRLWQPSAGGPIDIGTLERQVIIAGFPGRPGEQRSIGEGEQENKGSAEE